MLIFAGLCLGVEIAGCGPKSAKCGNYTILYNGAREAAVYEGHSVPPFAEMVVCEDGCADHLDASGNPQKPRLSVTLVGTDGCRNVTLVNYGPAMVPADHGYALEGASLDELVRGATSVCTTSSEVLLTHHGNTLQKFGISGGITLVDGNHTVIYTIQSGPTPTTVAAVVVGSLLVAWLFNAWLSGPS